MIAIYHRGMFICRAKDNEDLCKKLDIYKCWFTPLELRYSR
jgi:hypothetical protein